VSASRPRHRALWAPCFVAAVVGGSAPARAESTPSLFPLRFALCTSLPAAAPTPAPSAPPVALQPLAVRAAPPTLALAPLVTIDVPVTQPVPLRAPGQALAAPAPVTLTAKGLDYRCIGFTRGAAGISRVLGAPPGARFAGHEHAASWRADNLRAAATARLPDAVAWATRVLTRPLPTGLQGLDLYDDLDARYHATVTLGLFGDTSQSQKVVALLRAREDAAYSQMWLVTLAALSRADRAAAEDYAATVVERMAQGKRPAEGTPEAPLDPDRASDAGLLRAAVPLLVTPNAARLATLKSLPTPRHYSESPLGCEVLAARVRLGDAALRAEFRKELATDLRTDRASSCYPALMPIVFPGESPDEVDTLLFRARYHEILRLVVKAKTLRDAGPLDAKWTAALAKLRAGLEKRLVTPQLAAAGDTRFRPLWRAQALAALAWLGHAPSAKELAALVIDPADDGRSPWVAALAMLELNLPNAADLAATRLRIGLAHVSTHLWDDRLVRRTFDHETDGTRLLDALAARGDTRVYLGLLSRSSDQRSTAAELLGQRRDAAACDVVLNAAGAAVPGRGGLPLDEAVDDALWSLSMLGSTCAAGAHRLALDASASAHARGMAIELLAMLRDPRAAGLAAAREGRDELTKSRSRARAIVASPE
jgi:hypothetical protein